jgi:glycosyltransferase involved in cell wall biosynthesis
MKILTITSLYPNESNPRFGIFIHNRLKELLTRNPEYEINVIAPLPWFPFISKFRKTQIDFSAVSSQRKSDGITIFHPRYFSIPFIGVITNPFFMLLCLVMTFLKNRHLFSNLQLIDCHYLYPDAVAVGWLSRIIKVPYFVTARGSDVTILFRKRYLYPLIKRCLELSKGCISVSNSLAKDIEHLTNGLIKPVVCRNGVDLTSFDIIPEQVRKEKKISHGFSNKYLILSVGNLVELKGHELIIRSIIDFEDVELLIIGEGHLKSKLNDLSISLGLQNRVHFLANQKQDVLKYYYNLADIFVLASSSEGMPNVVLESLACGTRVIATNVGGVPEIIKDITSGVVLKTRTVECLRNTLQEEIFKNYDRDSVRETITEFGWVNTINTINAMFKKI